MAGIQKPIGLFRKRVVEILSAAAYDRSPSAADNAVDAIVDEANMMACQHGDYGKYGRMLKDRRGRRRALGTLGRAGITKMQRYEAIVVATKTPSSLRSLVSRYAKSEGKMFSVKAHGVDQFIVMRHV